MSKPIHEMTFEEVIAEKDKIIGRIQLRLDWIARLVEENRADMERNKILKAAAEAHVDPKRN